MKDGEEMGHKDREREIKAGIDKLTTERRIAKAVLLMREASTAEQAGQLDPERIAARRAEYSWLTPEELAEAVRRADQADAPIDPQAMSDDLMDRLREQIQNEGEKNG